MQAARRQRIAASHEKLVVDALTVEVLLAAGFIEVEPLRTKWRVADGKLSDTIANRRIFKADASMDDGLRIQCFDHAAGQRIKFNAEETRVFAQIGRRQAKEVADANRRLKHNATGKAQVLCRRPHGAHNILAGVVCVEDGTVCALQFIRSQDAFKILGACFPAFCVGAIRALECGFQSAPADISSENFLLCRGGAALL